MARRDRDRVGGADDERRGGRAPTPGAGPRPAAPAHGGPRGNAPATAAPRSNAAPGGPRRSPQEPPRPRSVAEDPNAYRSPGFQDVDQNPYKIDYAGLPKDVEDEETAGAAEAPATQGPARAPSLPRGMLGRNQDRRGTDPNAYRSPAFQDLDRVHQRYGARRGGRPSGPVTPVRPEGAPADVEEPELTPEPPTPTEG